jgi:uncharacterized coiled-coil protein SlyX
MNDIKVYDLEKELGLEDKIRSQASILFDAPVQKKKMSTDLLKTFASEDDPDLYKVYSILVSTVWNKNDDVFTKEEVWAARNTPVFKPTNLEHDETQMVGAIIESWPVDIDFELINDDIDISDLPEEYHILVSSVIYRQWQDPELKARAEELIQEIEAGEKYVSMECIFKGFDYGITSPDGKNHVIARNEESSFLTKQLRAYGGPGTYQDHKIGRVLRNVTFSGKGFVNKPANPDSIIFDRDKVFSFANIKNEENLNFIKNGVNTKEKQLYSEVNISKKENIMSNEIFENQIKELKEAVASLNKENSELSSKLAEANESEREARVTELETTVAELEAKIADLTSQLTEAGEKSESLASELASKSEELETVLADMHDMKEEDKKKKRKDKMAEAGLSDEEIEAKYETLASLSDEQFDMFITTVADMHVKKKKDEEKEKGMKDYAMKEKASEEAEATEEVEETEAAELVQEETEVGNVAVSSENEEDELSTTRAALAKWVEEVVIKDK